MTRAARRHRSVAGLFVVLVVLTGVVPVMAGPAGAEPAWRSLLRLTPGEGATDLRGELLWINWVDGEPEVAFLDVEVEGDELTVRTGSGYTMGLGEHGGLTNHDQGWFLPLPAAALAGDAGERERDLAALEAKYRVRILGSMVLAGGSCTRMELRRRADGALRERLCIAPDTGLVLRRETYGLDGERSRMAVYLTLREGAPPRASRAVPLERITMERMPVADQGLDALRAAGWALPEELPGRYRAVGVYAMDTERPDAQALQAVYRDGLYTVSLFQQRGRPDWSALPEGARPVEDLPWQAYEWPGAVPQRIVWEASGTTFSLVGDAPPDELIEVAKALPRPRRPTLWERLGRGLGRLWSWVSPWS